MTNQGSIPGRCNNTWSYTSTLPWAFLALCLIQDRDNFTCLTLLDICQILGKLWTCIPRHRLVQAFLYSPKSYGSTAYAYMHFPLRTIRKVVPCLRHFSWDGIMCTSYSELQIWQWNCKTGTVMDLCPYGINRVGIIQIVQELLEAWIQINIRR